MNIYVAEIYSVGVKGSEELLSLPAGSETELEIFFLDEQGRPFASKLEGVDLEVLVSHPRVAKAETSSMNSLLKVVAVSPGKANIIVRVRVGSHQSGYVIEDVLRVEVETLIMPAAPVHATKGAIVNYMRTGNKI